VKLQMTLCEQYSSSMVVKVVELSVYRATKSPIVTCFLCKSLKVSELSDLKVNLNYVALYDERVLNFSFLFLYD
jgi:hypothetical protein